MILRHAAEADRVALLSFDIGNTSSPWLSEVAEIVAGLLEWRDDPNAIHEGREVIVAEENGEVVGVCAHTALVTDNESVWPNNRYLMVTAVRVDHQRAGVARLLVESLLAELAARGVRTIEWLVHPANGPSISFSRNVIPEADELNPPEDKPYVLFVVRL